MSQVLVPSQKQEQAFAPVSTRGIQILESRIDSISLSRGSLDASVLRGRPFDFDVQLSEKGRTGNSLRVRYAFSFGRPSAGQVCKIIGEAVVRFAQFDAERTCSISAPTSPTSSPSRSSGGTSSRLTCFMRQWGCKRLRLGSRRPVDRVTKKRVQRQAVNTPLRGGHSIHHESKDIRPYCRGARSGRPDSQCRLRPRQRLRHDDDHLVPPGLDLRAPRRVRG